VQLETFCGLEKRTGERIYIWKDPANELAGYPYHVPNGTNLCRRHEIMVASHFNGWIMSVQTIISHAVGMGYG
jgi:hypothetical protein